jgi:hypothetical protein
VSRYHQKEKKKEAEAERKEKRPPTKKENKTREETNTKRVSYLGFVHFYSSLLLPFFL